MTYAYVCTRCHHLASRHYWLPETGSVTVGLFQCSHRDCACEIGPSTPLTAIDKATFDATFADRLHEYVLARVVRS